VNPENLKQLHEQQVELADQVEYLASEVKLLALNLAIIMAKLKAQKREIKELEPGFSRLVNKANDIANKVLDIIKAFREQARMISSLPASSRIVEQRGGYDAVEVKLKEVYELSQNLIRTINIIKGPKETG